MRPGSNDKDDFGELAGLVCLISVDFWYYSTCSLPAQFQRRGIHRKLLIIFSLGLWDIVTFFFLFFFFCVNGYCLTWETKRLRG